MRLNNTSRGIIAGLLLCGTIIFLLYREMTVKRPQQLFQTVSGQVEMCLSCHTKEKLDLAHDTSVLGCSPCHLGDPLAFEKDPAHQGIIKNPGDLRVVEKACGISGCHGADVHKVKNSLMATNRGIIATLLYYWGEAEDQNGDYAVEKLLKTGQNSLALDYYRKLCATCHLWKQKGDLPGVFGEKGGGCTACHFVIDPAEPVDEKNKPHPKIVKKVPVENCVRCHNRSGRIGISYTGVYESEGYGTPFADGEQSANRLPGERFFLKLPADIHYQRGMACIDCHTRNEIMGDGNRYAHFEDQLEITCGSCHAKNAIGTTEKGNTLNNVFQAEDGSFYLLGKLDDKKHPIKPPLPSQCEYPGHQRLACQSCHATWVPQCYGCHVKQDKTETHLDKLTLKETPGWWEEGRSYIRYERPALAIWRGKVMPATPGCQDVVTLVDSQGDFSGSFNSFTMAAIDPHTTQLKGRRCEDCHSSGKAIGLGEGTIRRENGEWQFQAVNQGIETPTGQTPPFDAYVDIHGTPLQKSFRPNMRPFNGEEIKRILRVGLCLPCHDSADDPAYLGYTAKTLCPKGFGQ